MSEEPKPKKMTTTDDESGLSQLRQQIEALPTFRGFRDDLSKKEVLKLVEAASEKYRQSRKSLLKEVLDEERQRLTNEISRFSNTYTAPDSALTTFGKGQKEAFLYVLQELGVEVKESKKRAEEAKPAATIQGKAESDSA